MMTPIQSTFDALRGTVARYTHRPAFLRNLDVVVLALIVASVLVVMADSVHDLHERYGHALYAAEWAFTLLFTVEYVVRLLSAPKPLQYARSFSGSSISCRSCRPISRSSSQTLHALIDVRLLRLLRVFRILGLSIYLEEGQMLMRALAARGARSSCSSAGCSC